MSIDEIIQKAIPINMSCAIEKQKAERRRKELKNNIEKLLELEINASKSNMRMAKL